MGSFYNYFQALSVQVYQDLGTRLLIKQTTASLAVDCLFSSWSVVGRLGNLVPQENGSRVRADTGYREELGPLGIWIRRGG